MLAHRQTGGQQESDPDDDRTGVKISTQTKSGAIRLDEGNEKFGKDRREQIRALRFTKFMEKGKGLKTEIKVVNED